MNELSTVISASIRNQRVRRDWRARDLSERTGWPLGMVCDLESGHRRVGVDDLPVLCRVFDISLVELLAPAPPADLEALRIGPASRC